MNELRRAISIDTKTEAPIVKLNYHRYKITPPFTAAVAMLQDNSAALSDSLRGKLRCENAAFVIVAVFPGQQLKI